MLSLNQTFYCASAALGRSGSYLVGTLQLRVSNQWLPWVRSVTFFALDHFWEKSIAGRQSHPSQQISTLAGRQSQLGHQTTLAGRKSQLSHQISTFAGRQSLLRSEVFWMESVSIRLTSVCSKCRDPWGTSNVEILHISKHFDFPQNFQIFLRESLESLLDFKSVDIQSIEPTFVCIWVLHSDPLRYLPWSWGASKI